MEQEKATYEITFMCEVLKIKRAGYYAWLARRATPGPRAARRARLRVRVKELFDEPSQVCCRSYAGCGSRLRVA